MKPFKPNPGEVYFVDVPKPIKGLHSDPIPLVTVPANAKGWTINSYTSEVAVDSSVPSLQILKKAAEKYNKPLIFSYLFKWAWGGLCCDHEDSKDGTKDRCPVCLGSTFKGGYNVQGQIPVLILKVQPPVLVPHEGLVGLVHYTRHIAPSDVLYHKNKNVAWRLSRVESGHTKDVPFTWQFWARELLPGDLVEEDQFVKRVEEYEKRCREKMQLTEEK